MWRDRIATKIQHLSRRQQLSPPALQRIAYNKLARVGGVKLTGLDRVSFDAITHANHHVD